MREIRPSGSEGGVALTTPFLPLSTSQNRRKLDRSGSILAYRGSESATKANPGLLKRTTG
jgi:hypothetical protein